MIRIGRVREKGAISVARPTPLGNPFVMRTEADRIHVCLSYEIWLNEKIEHKHFKVIEALFKLLVLSKERDITLGCYCAPKACHAESIKRVLEERADEIVSIAREIGVAGSETFEV